MLEYTNASQCLACHSHEEGTTKDESYNEDALQDILEEENITGQAENLATTEVEQSSDFEDPAEVDVTFWSKDGKKILFEVNAGQRQGSLNVCVCVCVCVCVVCVRERERERKSYNIRFIKAYCIQFRVGWNRCNTHNSLYA